MTECAECACYLREGRPAIQYCGAFCDSASTASSLTILGVVHMSTCRSRNGLRSDLDTSRQPRLKTPRTSWDTTIDDCIEWKDQLLHLLLPEMTTVCVVAPRKGHERGVGHQK